MTPKTLQKEIEESLPRLLDIARELTWNRISDNCEFILTEIKDTEDNFETQRLIRKKENDKKRPLPFVKAIPKLQSLYDNLYDINLHVYRAGRRLTIIDIRYYLKSSLDQEYRKKISDNPPMLHCKLTCPPWVTEEKKKFDINWEHKILLAKWKLFWMGRTIKRK